MQKFDHDMQRENTYEVVKSAQVPWVQQNSASGVIKEDTLPLECEGKMQQDRASGALKMIKVPSDHKMQTVNGNVHGVRMQQNVATGVAKNIKLPSDKELQQSIAYRAAKNAELQKTQLNVARNTEYEKAQQIVAFRVVENAKVPPDHKMQQNVSYGVVGNARELYMPDHKMQQNTAYGVVGNASD